MNTPTLEQIRIMNTRPTPETDKFFATFADGEAAPSHAEYYARLQDLERERDEARATCSELVTDNDAITLARTVVRITQERDEARGQRDRLAEALRMITTFDFSNAIMVTELEEAIDVAWGSITTDVRYEMCRDSFSIGFRMGANSFLENAESTRAENKP